MILQIDDWKFDIDMERTMAYSAKEAAEHCDCAYCRNFYAAVDEHCSALRPFLAQFGLDIEAPDVLYPYDAYWDRMCYEGKYVVFGSIIKPGTRHFDLLNAYIWPMEDTEFSFEEPHFVLSLEELEIFWVLDEPLKDVVSPANEPPFLKKMWQRLLGKAQKDKTDS
jgi:hypothetical protein